MFEEVDVLQVTVTPPLAAIVADHIACRAPVSHTINRFPSTRQSTTNDRNSSQLEGQVDVDIFSRFPVDLLLHVVEHADWPTLAVWRSVSRSFFAAVAICLQHRYEDHVKPFVNNVPLFNAILTHYGAIISGSTALHFFHPDVSWSPNDLDIYVSDDLWPALIREFRDPNGLNFTPYVVVDDTLRCDTPDPVNMRADEVPVMQCTGTSDTEDDSDVPDSSGDEHSYGSEDGSLSPIQQSFLLNGLRDVRTLTTPSGRRVDVIRSPSTSPITPLRFFWSTLVMNFLTPDAAVCGYPSVTLDHMGVLKQGLTRRDKAAAAKYQRRGYTFLGDDWRESLDMWDYLFFGERDALVVDFRATPQDKVAALPIKRTSRGWMPTPASSLPRQVQRLRPRKLVEPVPEVPASHAYRIAKKVYAGAGRVLSPLASA